MKKIVRMAAAAALIVFVLCLLPGCDEDDVIVNKAVKGETFTNEEVAKYQRNKKDYDRRIMNEVIVAKLVQGIPLSESEAEVYNKAAKDFNSLAAKRKDKMMEEAIIEKFVSGGQMSQEEVSIYNKNKNSFDSTIKDRKKLQLEKRILEKLVNEEGLNADEAAAYTDDKKAFDEKVIGLRTKRQSQARPKPDPRRTAKPQAMVEKTESAPPPVVEMVPIKVQKDKKEKTSGLYVPYLKPIPCLPYIDEAE